MFRSFFSTIFRGSSAVLCAVTIPPADLRSLNLYYYAVCGRMCTSSVRVWCSCLLVICRWYLRLCFAISVQDQIVIERSFERVINFKHLKRKQSSTICSLVFCLPHNCKTREISLVGYCTFLFMQ